MTHRSDIWFCGDVHGDLRKLRRSLAEATDKPCALILLGDLDPPEPVGQWLAPLAEEGSEVWFIHGNHETDNDRLYANMFLSPGAERNLDGQVIEICGLRIAGLGGIFREQVWYPPGVPGFDNYESMVEDCLLRLPKAQRNGWDNDFVSDHGLPPTGMLRKHRSSIFPDTYHALADQRADVLVTHEAPSCHIHGFEAIDLLAQIMGVEWVLHGHHHESYHIPWEGGNFGSIGVGLRSISRLTEWL